MYKWINGNFKKDLLGILLPGFLGIALAFVIFELQNRPNQFLFTILCFFLFGVIDAGHVYLTIWRTWLYEKEWKTSTLNWLIPVSVAVIMFVWIDFGVPYLWRVTLYFTVYHHIRQFYGVQKWYQHLYKRNCRWSDFFLYVLTVLPFLILHFRAGVIDGYYVKGDLLKIANDEIYRCLHFLYLIFVLWWLAFEIRLAFRIGVEGARFAHLASTGILCGFSFMFSRNYFEIVVPLMASHGVTYFSLMTLSLRRISFPSVWGIRSMPTLLLLTALILGGGTYWLEYEVLDINNSYLTGILGTYSKALLVLYFIPLFSHYIFDSIIWRKKHFDGIVIYE